MKKLLVLCLVAALTTGLFAFSAGATALGAIGNESSSGGMIEWRSTGHNVRTAGDVNQRTRTTATATPASRYQGTKIQVTSPGTKNVAEQDLTKAQMSRKMGTNTVDGVHNRTSDDIVSQMKTYWMPNSLRQITGTFQSFQGVNRNVSVGFTSGISDPYGVNPWAQYTYYGYPDRMTSVAILLDTDDCLDAGAEGLVSGTGDIYKFDQILAHELMHCMVAEMAPGYLLGGTNTEWFNEGVAEMVNGGIPHMAGRSASQLCGGLGSGLDYGGAYLAVSYASWLSACNGYGDTCTVTADNLAYGLDRILASLRETGNLNTALLETVGMNVPAFEKMVRADSSGKLQAFQNSLVTAATNSEGNVGSGSVVGGNLKLSEEYVIANHPSGLTGKEALTFNFVATNQ